MVDNELPPDIEYRLNQTLLNGFVDRTEALEYLVSLQETELALLWLALALSIGYTWYRTRRRD